METIWNSGILINMFFQNMGSVFKIPMDIFSFFGSEIFFLLLLPAIYWCIDLKTAIKVGIILLVSASINDALKILLHGPRPYWYSSDIIKYAAEYSFGMPSGHSQNSLAVWGVIAYQINRRWAWISAGILVILIGISRMYLGVHFPHDVITGWLLGALILWATLHFWDKISDKLSGYTFKKKIALIFSASMILIIMPLIPYLWLKIINWQMPAAWAEFSKEAVSLNMGFATSGMLFGFLTGMSWLDQRGGFETGGKIPHIAIRYFLGLAGILILYFGLKIIFGAISSDADTLLFYILRYIRYLIVGLWVSAAAPGIFILFRLSQKKV